MSFRFRREGDPPDPAVLAAARRRRVELLTKEAQQAEREAAESWEADQEKAEHLALTRANNLRLRALSVYLKLEDPNVD